MSDIQYKGKYVCIKVDDEIKELLKRSNVSLSDALRQALIEVLKNIDAYPELKVRLLYRYMMRYYVVLKRLRKIAYIGSLLDAEIETYRTRFADKQEWFEVFGSRIKRILREVERAIDEIVKTLQIEEFGGGK